MSCLHSMCENTYILQCCNLVYVELCTTTQSFQGDCGPKRMICPLPAALANNVCLSRITAQAQALAFWTGFLLFESPTKT